MKTSPRRIEPIRVQGQTRHALLAAMAAGRRESRNLPNKPIPQIRCTALKKGATTGCVHGRRRLRRFKKTTNPSFCSWRSLSFDRLTAGPERSRRAAWRFKLRRPLRAGATDRSPLATAATEGRPLQKCSQAGRLCHTSIREAVGRWRGTGDRCEGTGVREQGRESRNLESTMPRKPGLFVLSRCRVFVI